MSCHNINTDSACMCILMICIPPVDPLANAQFRSAPRRIGIVLDSLAIKTDDDILHCEGCPVNRVLLIKLQNKRENAPSQRAEAMSTLHTTEMGEFGGNSGHSGEVNIVISSKSPPCQIQLSQETDCSHISHHVASTGGLVSVNLYAAGPD